LADGKASLAHDKIVKVAITAAELVFQAEDVGTRKGEIGVLCCSGLHHSKGGQQRQGVAVVEI
jgi:hypothetical protein